MEMESKHIDSSLRWRLVRNLVFPSTIKESLDWH